MFRSKKITCYVLLYDQLEIIKRSLSFLTAHADRLEIVAIENPSAHTPEIKAHVDTLGQQGLIARYYLFSKNITGNAFSEVIKDELHAHSGKDYILITDGDLICRDENWLDEELHILKRNKDVFACATSLDMSNLPLKAFPEAKDWVPPDINTYDDFYEALTGIHLLLIKSSAIYGYLNWQTEQTLSFVDGNLHRYCYEFLNKKWARTKNSKAYHLTWDLYQDRNHEYTRLKTGKQFADTWHHGEHSDYQLTEY